MARTRSKPISRPIGSAEQAVYREALGRLPVPATDRDALIAATAGFMAADDGQPVYMLNLMRFHDQLRPWPGVNIEAASPQEANTYYEDNVFDIALPLGLSMAFAGETQGVGADPAPSTCGRNPGST